MSDSLSPNGRTLRGYQLGQPLGEGGFGAVYRAQQATVQRDVAVKIILPKYANKPDFIRRFESEAHIVARLEHPHIVPLYDFWRDPDGAYIVMRLLRGGSLKASMADSPWKIKPIVTLLRQLCSAVKFAHQHHIIHQDIKPANILLDEAQNAYLSDFGIARNLELKETSEGFVGSPNYTAPELIDGLPPSPQSDLYNVGILLYELLAGEHPFHEHRQSPVAMLNAHLNDPFPAISRLRPDLPPQLDDILFAATAKDYRERYTSVTDFERAVMRALQAESRLTQDLTPITRPTDVADLHAALLGRNDAPAIAAPEDSDNMRATDTTRVIDMPPARNPYRGLEAFQKADADFFYGREGLVGQLLARLQGGDRLLTLLGASGSGKSSVARAGLLTALNAGAIPHSENWFTLQITPGSRPLEEIETALLSIAINPPNSLLEQILSDERGLARAIKRCLPLDNPEVELVLLIDQFEELFTVVTDAAQREFILASLAEAVSDERGRFRLILTLRADFYDRPLAYPHFGKLLHQSTIPVLPLTPEELEQAIVLPAERVGLDLETGLLAALIADSDGESGGMPLLQYTLTQLFEAREGNMLTRAAYQALGGVMGALTSRADGLYAALDSTAQGVAQQLFLRLVTLGEGSEDTRRRVLQSELVALNPAIMPSVIEHFGAARLLTFDHDPSTRLGTVEVAHEALIRTWGQLREWLNRSRDDLRQEARLGHLAHDWREAESDSSFLLRGAQLEEAERWANATSLSLSPQVSAFLSASQAERDHLAQEESQRRAHEVALESTSRRRLQMIAAVMAFTTLMGFIFSGIVFDQRGKAIEGRQDAQTQQAEAQSARQTSDANVVVIQTQVAEAQTRADQIQSLSLLANAQRAYLDQEEDLAFALIVEAVQIPNAPPQALSTFAGWATQPAASHVLSAEDTQWVRVQFSPDGKTVVASGLTRPQQGQDSQGRLTLWDSRSAALLQQFDSPPDAVTVGLAFSPDGQQVMTASSDQMVRGWSVQTGQMLWEWQALNSISSMALNPNGTRVVIGGTDGQVTVYNVQTGQLVAQAQPLTGSVNRVQYGEDGQTVIAVAASGEFILWQPIIQHYQDFKAETGAIEALAVLSQHPVFFYGSPTGGIYQWGYTPSNLDQLSPRGILQEHEAAVTALAVSPDETQLLSADREGRLLLWDLARSSVLVDLGGHEAVISDVAFNADGTAAASVDVAGQIRLWDVSGQTPPDDLAGLMAWVEDNRYLRPLTCEERATYLLEECS